MTSPQHSSPPTSTRPVPPSDALARTASSVFAVLKETLDSGERELRLIAAQDAIASPACEFEVQQVR